MENENETVDSPNDDKPAEVESNETADADALGDQNRRLAEQNRQLFARAKKAEGFDLQDGKWVKTEKVEVTKEEPSYKPPEKPEAPPKSDDLDFAQLAFNTRRSPDRIIRSKAVSLCRIFSSDFAVYWLEYPNVQQRRVYLLLPSYFL